MNADRWYYRVFQSAPDLIRSLLPGSAAAANALGLDPGAPGDRLYRYCFSSRRLRLRRSLAAMKRSRSKSSATAQIQALPLEHLEALADALLDFQGPADLSAWLAANS